MLQTRRSDLLAPALWLGLAGAALEPTPAPSEAAARVVRLTETGARNGQPFFSPDGRWLSLVSDRGGSWQVWIMRPDGGPARQVTDHERPVGWPSWSADGSAILYYVEVEGGYRLMRIDLAGGEPRPLLADGATGFRPLLSPAGDRLLFDRFGGDPPNHDLFVVDLASGEESRLTRHPGYDSDARWSPDGQRIVFHSDREASESFHIQIYVMTADGRTTRLTSGPARNGYPAWSPDGSRIVYASEMDGNRDLWVMNADGGDARRLTEHPGFDGDPVWWPDGRAVVFATDRYGGSRELARLEVPPS